MKLNTAIQITVNCAYDILIKNASILGIKKHVHKLITVLFSVYKSYVYVYHRIISERTY